MRLVDADALEYTLGSSDEDIYCRYTLEEAPTVDAVPVEWLEEKLTNHPEIPYAVTDGINAVLDMWREEADTERKEE